MNNDQPQLSIQATIVTKAQLNSIGISLTSNAPAEEIDAWIREHIPEYDEIIEDNVAIVLGELVENSDAIQK